MMLPVINSCGCPHFAKMNSSGSFGVNSLALCGDRILEKAKSELRAIVIALFCNFIAEMIGLAFEPVLDSGYALRKPLLPMKLNFSSTAPGTTIITSFENKLTLKVYCRFEAITFLCNVLTGN